MGAGGAMRLERYIRAAERAGGFRSGAMVGKRRDAETVAYRHAAMICAREDGEKLEAIGAAFGGRDHTTVVHAIRKNDRSRVAEVRAAMEAEFRG